jgi:O-antigen ligase
LLFWLLQPNKAVISVVMVLVVLLGAFFMPASYLERLQTIGNYEEDASSTKRLDLWRIGIRLFLSNPILGVGPENFIYYAESTPHNAYIQVASEMGALALILYVGLLASALKAAWRARSRSARWRLENSFQHSAATGVICSLAAIVVQGLFTGLAHREFVYIFIALAYSLDVLSEKTDREQSRAPRTSPNPAPQTESQSRLNIAAPPPVTGHTALSRYGAHGKSS